MRDWDGGLQQKYELFMSFIAAHVKAGRQSRECIYSHVSKQRPMNESGCTFMQVKPIMVSKNGDHLVEQIRADRSLGVITNHTK